MTVSIENHASYIVLTLDRPDELNALSAAMIKDLREAFEQIETRGELRSVILTGSGNRAFSAGTDLSGPDEDRAREISEAGQTLFNQIETCAVPVIAAINGAAGGVGCELALACHLRIVSTSASFTFPEARPASIAGQSTAQRLAREIGIEHALEISRSGRTVFAEEALRIGLINRIAPEDRLLIEAELLARQISTMAPLAIRACLEAVTRGIGLTLNEGLALEAQLFSSLFATNDVREGTSAFLEKRQPVFKGM
jgi:enoyl-CoA hydratase